MKVTPLSSTLSGEHLIGVSPVMKPETEDAGWRARLNFWTGRALTEQALDTEQTNREARLTWRGRLASPGIVTGLDVALEIQPADPSSQKKGDLFIHIMPGYGIMATGDDVYLPQSIRVEFLNFKYFKPKELTFPWNPLWFDYLDSSGAIPLKGSIKSNLPWAVVLLLQPATFSSDAHDDTTSPCPTDPTYDAFKDSRLNDASRLILHPLDEFLNNNQLTIFDSSFRNRLASVILQKDIDRVTRQQVLYRDSLPPDQKWGTALTSDALLPWENSGVPIGLIGIEPVPGKKGYARFFLDRNSVARPGGGVHPRPRPAIVPNLDPTKASPAGSGTPAIWHSRVAQFNEHLNDLLNDNQLRPSPNDTDAQLQLKWSKVQKCFHYLPPAGLLPPEALHFLKTPANPTDSPPDPSDRADKSWFFPQNYSITAVPIVNEEVEAMLAESAPLSGYDPAHFDPKKPEPVRVLVPLPESKFDPKLLVIEQADPMFEKEVKRLYALRQDWRQRRDYVRGRRDDLNAIAQGKEVPAPDSDPDQIEAEPTEKEMGFPFPYELIPITNKPSPWKIDISFSVQNVLSTISKLSVLLHVDEDRTPTSIDLQWTLSDTSTAISHFDSMPAVDVNDTVIMPGSPPVAVGLFRNFERTLADSGLGKYNAVLKLSGMSVILNGGLAAIVKVSFFDTNNNEQTLWDSNTAPAPANMTTDGWKTISGPLHLAPFEDLYKPVPADGSDFQTLIDRLKDASLMKELTHALLATDSSLKVATRNTYLQFSDVGLERLIAVMTKEADKADAVVDLNFSKIQAHMQQMQSVISGDPDAGQALTSPAVSAMSAVSGLNAAKTQMSQSMTVNPNWTKQTDIDIKKATIKTDVNLTIDGTAEMLQSQPLNFTRRFAYGPAHQAYQAITTGMISILKNIANLNIGYYDNDLVPEITQKSAQVKFAQLASFTLDDISQLEFPCVLAYDKNGNISSGDIVARGIHRADLTSVILRKVENYIARRRQLIADANTALAAARAQIDAANLRIITLNGKLGEARHDMSVARVLWQEELARVDAINQRRDDLIATQVKQLVFVRPRCVSLLSYDLPSCELDSADALAPIPACLQSNVTPPDELEAYLQLFRHAPVRWFLALAPLLREIDTRDRMMRLLTSVQQSARQLSAFAIAQDTSASARVYAAGFGRIEQLRRRAAEQMIAINSNAWEDHYRLALTHASLGDLMLGAHGRHEISRAAAQEFEDFGKVAACLYTEFNAVQPGIRMAWVERYSQFDRPSPLRDITLLPQAGALSRQSRKRFQAYLDWIFSRIDQNDQDAVSLVNDLARVCLLLASHAPVNRLILGHVRSPMSISAGLLIPVQPAQPDAVRVGMQFQVWSDNTCVARGTVENLRPEEVAVRVEETHPDYKNIDTNMSVQFLPAVTKAQPSISTAGGRSFTAS